MGDRAMTEIKTEEGSLYFYTHSYGFNLPTIANAALEKAQKRIGDDSYATRIVLDSLIKDCGARDQETGAGIMLSPCHEDEYNGDRPSVIIDLVNNRVETVGRKE